MAATALAMIQFLALANLLSPRQSDRIAETTDSAKTRVLKK